MNEEKLKMVEEIANKLTEEIISSCEPKEMGVVASLILKNLHNMYQSRITSSMSTLDSDKKAYSDFLNNIDLPLIEDRAYKE